MEIDWTTISTIWSIIATGLTAWLAWRDHRMKERTAALESALEAVKRFDAGTAMSFMIHARALDHESWHLQRLIDRYIGEVPTNDKELQAHGRDTLQVAGRVHGMAHGNFKTMARIYQLAGNPISSSLIDHWISSKFIPEFYREWLLIMAVGDDQS